MHVRARDVRKVDSPYGPHAPSRSARPPGALEVLEIEQHHVAPVATRAARAGAPPRVAGRTGETTSRKQSPIANTAFARPNSDTPWGRGTDRPDRARRAAGAIVGSSSAATSTAWRSLTAGSGGDDRPRASRRLPPRSCRNLGAYGL